MSALSAAFQTVEELAPGADAGLTRAKLRGLLQGYDARWHSAPYEILAIEETVTADLWHPSTKGKSRSFILAGKIDLRLKLGEDMVLMDHKTTSDDISDPSSTYWRQLAVESQLSHYWLLEWMNGRKPAYAVWDVVRKPAISPRQLSKADWSKTLQSGVYYQKVLSSASLDALQHEQRETFEMFEARLAADCTMERPAHYFQRRQIPRLDRDILDHAGELWDHSQEILQARRFDRHARNSDACLSYGSPCVYLGVCSGISEFDNGEWKQRSWRHPELPVLGGNGTEVLTSSRLKVFQNCRKRHLYQYEQGWEKVGAEDSDALYFGTLWHEALASYFRAIQQEQRNEYANSVSVNEIGSAAGLINSPTNVNIANQGEWL